MTAMGIALLIKFFILSPYGIPSPSMVPTLNVGDVAVANKLDDEPDRGDIIIFKGNDVWGSDKDYIKRVIGVPGDTVGGCTPDGSLMVNGEPLWEDYLQDDSGCNFPTITVPDNTVWVMGDNRGNSADSRYHNQWHIQHQRCSPYGQHHWDNAIFIQTPLWNGNCFLLNPLSSWQHQDGWWSSSMHLTPTIFSCHQGHPQSTPTKADP